MSAVNETLIRDVVAEVLGRLGSGTVTAANPSPAPAAPAPVPRPASSNTGLRGRFGVFATADEACAAAQESFLQLRQKGVEARRKIEEIVKAMAGQNAESWGRLEF